MNGPFEEIYFNWLCAKVLSQNPNDPTYKELLDILYRTEFVWVIMGDKNRADDGCELRLDFLRETHFENDLDWFEMPCSVLEVLIAFARRASFQTDTSVVDWFWKLLTNLKLEEYRRISEDDIPVIQDILHTFIWRTYSPNGEGGLFPLGSPHRDQRKVEIWYQFCDYAEDQALI